MGNRLTVMKILKKRLREEKFFIKSIGNYNDLVNTLGGVEITEQDKINAINDIKQLEFLIEKLREFTKPTNQHPGQL